MFLCGLTLPPFTAKIGANRQREILPYDFDPKTIYNQNKVEILEYLKEHASSTVSVADIKLSEENG